ncbi:MAG: electron transfer flavoprotein subunit alpha [Elusimicrobiota bacterium]|jgi:electron transfer flavoprotein alpha subunit|nr:electron transfer flavoprotein subunit alpha [Elusimicrobiota bacterium]
MSTIKIIDDKCVGCGQCANECPFGVISMIERPEHPKKFKLAKIDINKCVYCGTCVEACKFSAIELQKDEPALAEVDNSLYKGVWVYAEQRHGEISSVVFELLSECKKLSQELSVPLSAVLIGGADISSKAQDLIERGADKVYVYDDPALAEFQDDPYTSILTALIKQEKPEIVVMGATNIGRSFASRVAARIKTGLTADCTALSVDIQTRNLQQTRPAFGGNIMATILTPHHRPQMSTVRHKVFKEATIQKGRQGEIIKVTKDDSLLKNRTKFIQFIGDDSSKINIADADIIVSGGRGLGGKEGFKLLKELADLLGGAVGASRAAVDADWISYSHQVGQTGRTVAPRVYIACGISGQIQHMVGMNSSDIIVAINKDPFCPMMKAANFSIEGDLFEVVPRMIKNIKELKK